MNPRHPLQQRNGEFHVEYGGSTLLRSMLAEALNKSLSEGMSCSASTRTGKTAIAKALEADFTKKRTALFLRRQCINHREKKVANPFLRRLRGDELGKDAADVHTNPMRALKNHCLNECDKLETDTVVFCLDEAQNLSLEELDVLKVLTGDLQDLGLRPFVLLMGQPELKLLRDALLDWKRGELVSRWMGTHCDLPGFELADVKGMCAAIDARTWPENSGVTYTQHYVPGLWAAGWRMAGHGEALWEAMRALAKSVGMPVDRYEVAGEYVRNAVLALLLHLRRKPDDQGEDAFKEAARLSRLTEAAKILVPNKSDAGMLRAKWLKQGLQRR